MKVDSTSNEEKVDSTSNEEGTMRHLGLLSMLAACSSSPATSDAGMDAGNDSNSADSGPLAPTTLRSFESNAEGISDACKIADYTKAQAILGEANNTWSMLEPVARSAGVPAATTQKITTTLSTLATDISGMKQRNCETDANAITLAVPDIFDHFVYSVPSDALRGDGVFRQLQIDAEYSDFTTANADFAATDAVWTRLRPLVVMQAPKRPDIPRASTVVVDTDTTMMQLQTAIAAKNATDLGAAAQAGLDEIDTMETIFK